MSMDFAGSFINALQAGQQNAQQRRRQNALMGAGQMASRGDARGGMNALLAGGYIDEANVFGQMGERQRVERTRDAAKQAYMGAQGDEASKLTAAAGAYSSEGDWEGAAQVREIAQGLTDEQRQKMAQGYQFFATTAATLAGQNLPPEQAKAQAIQMLRQSPYGQSDAIQQIEAMPAERFTPQALSGYAQTYGMSAAEILGERTRVQENADAIKREDERYRQQRNDRFALARGAGGGQGFDPTNPTGVKASAEQRGRIALSLGNVISAQNQLTAIEKSAQQNPEVGFTRQGPNANATPLGNDWGARIAEAIPFDGGTTARIVGGESYAQYETASRTFEQSILPAFAGSAVTESEAKRFVRSNLPRLGDSPAILQQKAENRARIVNAAASMVGAEPPYPEVGIWQAAAPEQQQTPTQQTQQTQASRAPAGNAQLPDPSEFLPGTVIQIGNERYTLSGDGRSWTKQGSQGFRGTETRPANGMR